jgi:hypothetical protein
MSERGLSGIYVRVQRGDKWLNMDFTDLTEEEMTKFLDYKLEKPEQISWVKGLAVQLAKIVRQLGDQFDIVVKPEDEDE